jgi:hypothetical protein
VLRDPDEFFSHPDKIRSLGTATLLVGLLLEPEYVINNNIMLAIVMKIDIPHKYSPKYRGKY